MSEESLKILPLDEICTIMIKTIDEYLLLEKLNKNPSLLESKRAELYTLHKVITDKKAEAAAN